MRVRLWVKHRINDTPLASTKGDIMQILPVEATGKVVYRSFYPIDMDLNIPCGVDFKPPYKCKECAHNHPEDCPVKKYEASEWDSGSALDRPKLVKKRVHNVDLKKLIPKELKEAAYKLENTKEEKDAIKARADSIEFPITEINEKTKTVKG